jgi:lipid-A-disaccharide synthase
LAFHRSAPTIKSFLLSAGEASGDNYGAQLIQSIHQLAPEAAFFGMGGHHMQSAGCELLVNAADVAVVGLAEVVTHLPRIYRKFNHLVAEAEKRRPDAAVLIDFPDFNLRLARRLHALKIPVFYFVSPQVWAWRSGRIKQIQKYVRKMIVIFPFEQDFYRKHGVSVSYVGHPLAYAPEPSITRQEFAARYGLNPSKPWIALLPGSRKKEVELNLPAMLQAAALVGSDYEYLLPVASTLRQESINPAAVSAARVTQPYKEEMREVEKRWEGDNPPTRPALMNWFTKQISSVPVPVRLTADARATLKHSVAAVVASGTATVEAALLGIPFVVVYRLSPLTWSLGRRLVTLDTFAMPNLIAGKHIVPELIQRDFTPQSVARELTAILPDAPRRRQMLQELTRVQQILRDNKDTEEPPMRAARVILGNLNAH